MTQQSKPFVRPYVQSDFTRMLETLLLDTDHPAPEWIKQQNWLPFDKEFSLSNLDKDDIQSILHTMEAAQSLILLALPPNSLSWDAMAQMEQAWAKLLVKVKRSEHGFERKQLTTSRIIQTPPPKEETEEGKKGVF